MIKRTIDAFPVRLHLRSDLHLARKAWHMLMGLVIAYIYLSGMSRTTAVVTLGCILGWDLMMETARLRIPAFNEKIVRIWGPFMRSNEVHRLSGIPYYLSAAILAIGIFPKPIAVLSIIYLACGDPIASLFGILYGDKGKRFANGKSLIGTAAGVATCMLATFIFFKAMNVSDGTTLLLTLIGGLAGGAAELLPLEVDDNFSIPVVSGFVLWLAFILLGA
jgi:diacylglycerol kinase (CTP)